MNLLSSIYSKNIFKGTLQLTAAGIFTRLLGMLNRIFLSRLVGAEGIGLFQMILPLYALLAIAASLGLPGAVAKMVADRYAAGDQAGQGAVLRLSLKIALPASLLLTAAVWLLFSRQLAFIPDSRLLPALRLIPLSFCLVAISAILRSFFQGRGNMTPLALSLAGEQLIRIGIGLLLAIYLLPLGLEYVMIGIACAIIIGELACFGILTTSIRRESLWRKPHVKTAPASCGLLREMSLIALPVLIVRLAASVTQTVESLLIPSRLQAAGFSSEEATALFGQFSGMALPLFFLPMVLIGPFNMALLPAVAGAATIGLKKRLLRLVNYSLAGTATLGVLSAFLLLAWGPLLADLLYRDPAAGRLVVQLAPLAPVAFLQFTTASVLHGMGRPGIAVANDLGGTAVSLLLIYYLTAEPALGIRGVIYGYGAAFFIISLLDCLCIYPLILKSRPGLKK